ncbi:hypothetical protein D5R81_19450 [Parashewanella spongiae]|uniref:Uncharacterized protein n=1 Tax=Parashewanella spongiae TaxID=342950 RepID=A0A3A6T664_9GAMM|nr:hypothetical protein [Parashewanella spongiae]MCL1080211.1 hypothetical protein [Parashewanella spongiae]RJY02190.1 hypothetical protein D5R81_19450 [Parashewanella spongiae]
MELRTAVTSVDTYSVKPIACSSECQILKGANNKEYNVREGRKKNSKLGVQSMHYLNHKRDFSNLYSAAQPSEFLSADAYLSQLTKVRQRVDKVSILRIYLSLGPAFGNLNVTLDIIRSWSYISKSQTVQIVVDAGDTETIRKLALMLPNLDITSIKSVLLIDGMNCEILLTKNPLQEIPKSLTISTLGCSKLLSERNYFIISPYLWISHNEIVFNRIVQQESSGYSESKYYPMHLVNTLNSCLLDTTQIGSLMLNSTKNNIKSIEWITDQYERKSAHISFSYGTHGYNSSDSGKFNLCCFIEAIKSELESFEKKIIILFIVNSSTGDRDIECQWESIATDTIKLIRDDEEFREITLSRGKCIYLFHQYSLPKAIFEHMVSISDLPVFYEGANTLELYQNLGKCHLSVSPWYHSGTSPENHLGHEQAYQLQLKTSSLLGVEAADLIAIIESMATTELKKTFECFLNKLLRQNHGLPTQTELDSQIKFYGTNTEKKEEKIFWNTVHTYFNSMAERNDKDFITLGFAEEFLTRNHLFPDCCLNNEKEVIKIRVIAETCRPELQFEFFRYLKKETITHLQLYIKQTLDPQSETQMLTKAIQKKSHSQEYNKIFQMIADAPDGFFN